MFINPRKELEIVQKQDHYDQERLMKKTTRGVINYIAHMNEKPKYHSTDSSKNVIELEPVEVDIINARDSEQPPSLNKEGLQLVEHHSKAGDLTNSENSEKYNEEIRQLLLNVTGADEVVIPVHGIVRYSERSELSGKADNSFPARFMHVDMVPEVGQQFGEKNRPESCPVGSGRVASYNIWRVLSPAPQDVPLAICDAQTVDKDDLVRADAIFDPNGVVVFSFESFVIRPNLKHQWLYFHDMDIDEALIFKAYDSDSNYPCNVSHGAFTDTTCPDTAPPRVSIEMRATAYWRD